MAFELKFDMTNAAFDNDPAGEVVRILKEVEGAVSVAGIHGAKAIHSPVRDINGNKIGSWSVAFEPPENYD